MDNRCGHRQRIISKLEHVPIGAKSIYPYELLEILLFFVNKRKDTRSLAKNMLERFKSITHIFSASAYELKLQPGIGSQTVILLRVIQGLILRMHLEKMHNEQRLLSLDSTIKYCQFCMGGLQHEQLRMFCLNKRNSLITDLIIQEGESDTVNFDMKKIIGQALEYKASAIIIVHNHPSRIIYPSNEDIQTTLQLKKLVEQLGIKLNDHIIITQHSYFSMKQMNII